MKFGLKCRCIRSYIFPRIFNLHSVHSVIQALLVKQPVFGVLLVLSVSLPKGPKRLLPQAVQQHLYWKCKNSSMLVELYRFEYTKVDTCH